MAAVAVAITESARATVPLAGAGSRDTPAESPPESPAGAPADIPGVGVVAGTVGCGERGFAAAPRPPKWRPTAIPSSKPLRLPSEIPRHRPSMAVERNESGKIR